MFNETGNVCLHVSDLSACFVEICYGGGGAKTINILAEDAKSIFVFLWGEEIAEWVVVFVVVVC